MSENIDQKLLLRNIKPTAMRELVYKILVKEDKAISLYNIEQQLDSVDRSTLFRTLKTFQQKGLIHSIDDGTGAVKYALCDDECSCLPKDLHIHFLCTKCKQTYCIKDVAIPKIQLPKGFTSEDANFVVKGICSNCKV